MKLLRELIRDQHGYILSAEAVLLGTIGVAGATVGLGALSKSLNDELTEVAYAFRSLDQSYCIEGETGCRSWTAGSCFEQQDVETSRAELGEWIAQQQNGADATEPQSSRSKEAEPQESRKSRRRKESEKKQRERKKTNDKRDSDAKLLDSGEELIIRRRSSPEDRA